MVFMEKFKLEVGKSWILVGCFGIFLSTLGMVLDIAGLFWMFGNSFGCFFQNHGGVFFQMNHILQ